MYKDLEQISSKSFVRSYKRNNILYVKISGKMDLVDNAQIANECAHIAKNDGPWIGIADLCEMTGFNSKGTDVWREVFGPITKNISSVYIATTSVTTRMVTQAWGLFVKKKINAFNTMPELVAEAKTHNLYLPEDIILLRTLPTRPNAR
ncbi:MAG: hypothetical protein KC582_02695 [Candidatus Magasanikbacteria bacterium]|nr:hypothetical protein [Candidatus Magasanikbacteria bacterium]MCA9389603.1 hypothetical protein [Candidatus Magasanikbacteria bacterium]MCA9391137.1 hypothetical protein [Candidatus Magasanikbacteria bacterium]